MAAGDRLQVVMTIRQKPSYLNSREIREMTIYNGIMRTAPAKPNITRTAITSAARIYLSSFPFSFRFLNFSENIGIRVTISSERINVIEINATDEPARLSIQAEPE